MTRKKLELNHDEQVVLTDIMEGKVTDFVAAICPEDGLFFNENLNLETTVCPMCSKELSILTNQEIKNLL